MASGQTNPGALVSTAWVDEHRGDTDNLRIVESNEDVLLYETGHIPGAVKIDWFTDLQDPIVRDYVDADAFAEVCARNGISNDTTVVFYGDKSNWWACYAFWTFKLFGHERCLIMDGGRKKWRDEDREVTIERPEFPRASYTPRREHDPSIRAFRQDTLEHMRAGRPMVDVRSPGEFSGELLHMADYPQEGALRGGHIPGARNVPWARATNEDGTFKSLDELRAIYEGEIGLTPGDDVIAYCRIGERSSHTWFVLKHLLGYDRVRNYDGSWTEWGNSVGLPIENDSAAPAGT
jgi:thiosulfate/3-mercaptopyruvate sulfurtransferase